MSLRYESLVRVWVYLVLVLTVLVQPRDLMGASVLPAMSVVQVADVKLHGRGVLSGQVVDASGANLVGEVVQLTQGPQIWKTRTDAEGCFQLTGLSGATYQLQTAGQTHLVRVWAAGTAPPGASRGLLVLQVSDVVRGQRCVSPNTNQFFRVAKKRLANPLVFGGIVATAVAIPVAIHNANADEDVPPATP